MVWVHKSDSILLPMFVISLEVCIAKLLLLSVILGEVFVVLQIVMTV